MPVITKEIRSKIFSEAISMAKSKKAMEIDTRLKHTIEILLYSNFQGFLFYQITILC